MTSNAPTVNNAHTLILDDVKFDKDQGQGRITKYLADHKAIIIPDDFDGVPMNSIGEEAFEEII